MVIYAAVAEQDIGEFVLVPGDINGKVFTPTEASGIGAFGAAVIAVMLGNLRTVKEWVEVLGEATKTTAALFIVIFGTLVFAQFINLSGLPYDMVFMVEDMNLSATGVVITVALIAGFMGMVFESIGILLLLVPVFLPTLIQSDVDMVSFGIVVVLVTELGLITPPIGMNVFVVNTVMPDLRPVTFFAVFRRLFSPI